LLVEDGATRTPKHEDPRGFARSRAPGAGGPLEKIAIVTGAARGIGIEIVRGLAREGYHVVLAVRDVEKGKAAAKDIVGSTQVMRLDVADLDSVRAFASEVLGHHPLIHLLVNNAGIHTTDKRRSPQGHELTFATNHLGHFLLTDLLLNALEGAAPSRVVNLASEAHRGAKERDFSHADTWTGMKAYTQSKLANILFTSALARRLEGTGVTTYAAHPGSVRTGWARGRESGLFRFVTAVASPFLLSPAKGARTPLVAALAAGLPNGTYLARGKLASPTSLARDLAAQEALWTLSVDWTRAS
jgi:NAD(P)-dependent dehydrogenase (short-subunit alcohol dehydrogenase family)